jgi:uncharacterized protein YacL
LANFEKANENRRDLLQTLLIVGGIIGGFTSFANSSQTIALSLIAFIIIALFNYTMGTYNPSEKSRAKKLPLALLDSATAIIFSLLITSAFLSTIYMKWLPVPYLAFFLFIIMSISIIIALSYPEGRHK